MARGWESKSVEDQIQEREASKSPATGPQASPEELQRRAKREGLLLVRIRTLTSLQTACDRRYRGHLEKVLADIDAQIAELGQ
jgi:multidrug efflux pump subunit AcrA (membrane-fusion protein)